MKNKKDIVLLLSLACSAIVVILIFLGTLESLELKSLDFRSHLFARAEKADTNIVIVAIDEKSLLEFKRNGVVWKWPRDFYGALVRYFHRGGAKAVVFDVLFPDPDIDRANTDAEESDGAFARAMQEAGNVVLASLFHREDDPLWEDNPLVHRPPYVVAFANDSTGAENFRYASLPIPLFQETTRGLGAANYYEDEDGICRRLPLFYDYRNHTFPQLGAAAYLVANGIDSVHLTSDGVNLAELFVPLNSGEYLISWYGKGGPDGCFQYYSAGALITSARDEELNRAPRVPSKSFKDKSIFVGSNAAGLHDLRNTPFTVYEPYPGVEISATILNNLLHKDFLVRVHPLVTIAALLAFSFVVAASFFWSKGVRLAIGTTLFCALGWTAASLLLFSISNLWLDWVAPILSVALTFAVSAVVSYETEGKARRQLRSVFSRYVSPEVVLKLSEKPDGVEMGGEEIEASVLFSDIKDFTAMSERMSPQELIEMLNTYFGVAAESILRHSGLVDKYIGDSIMAVFGAPLPTKNHALQACRAALEISRLITNLKVERIPTLETRIGINTGKMVVGNVGSRNRHDYTAIGDTVNLASRLEGANKIYGTKTIISEFTFKQVADMFIVRPLEILRVKGKEEAVAIYELLGDGEVVSKEMVGIAHKFRDGLNWYRQGSFEKAEDVFQAILSQAPQDGPSKLYFERCRGYLASPPPQPWDGIYTLSIK